VNPRLLRCCKKVFEGKDTIVSFCRKYGISEATYYKLKSRYSGVGSSEFKRLQSLELENNRLKKMSAEISLDHKLLRESVEKKCL
jgi:putative transposase